MEGMADAVRGMRHESGLLSPAQIEEKIRSARLGLPIDISNHLVNGHWVRPVEYPDMDSIAIPQDFDGVYLTYDLRKTPDYAWIGVYVRNTNAGVYYVERGHLENGVFIADETFETAHNMAFRRRLEAEHGAVQLWRVRSSAHIYDCKFATSGSLFPTKNANSMQPCVERVGRLNWLTTLSSSSLSTTDSSYSYGTVWLERDAIKCSGLRVCTSIGAWTNCYSLQELDVSEWNTSNWLVTSLQNCWNSCYSLVSLDLSAWDTSNWAVRILDGAWYSCIRLRELKIESFDTSNWEVTSIQNCWSYCANLRHLDLSGWNTANWGITTLYTAWMYCRSLECLDVSTWDTSNWAVSSLSYAWSGCSSLRVLDLSGWDTSHWVVATMNSMLSECYSLQAFTGEAWDTSNWAVTNMSSMFHKCYSLQELDLSRWDTANWRTTTLSALFLGCISLSRVDLSGWDTSEWPMATITQFFYDCESLEVVDLSDWDASNWSITSLSNVFAYSYALHTVKWPKRINLAGVTTVSDMFRNLRAIRHITGMNVAISHSYSNLPMLERESLLDILTCLPAVTASRTVTLGAVNKAKLTVEQIAIATQKGWTVA